jgi:valyl-tRNA synthetase
VTLKGLIDFKEEERRVRKAISGIEKELDVSQKKLSNRGFMQKAPEEIVAEVKARADDLAARLFKLKQNLSFLETLDD